MSYGWTVEESEKTMADFTTSKASEKGGTDFHDLYAAIDGLETVLDHREAARKEATGWAVDNLDHPTARAVVTGGVLTELELPDYIVEADRETAEAAINGLILAAYLAFNDDYESRLDGNNQ